MGRFLFGLLLLASAIAQATVIPRNLALDVTPDVCLVLLLVWSALHGVREALIWAFALGILLDVLALDAFGTNGLALLAVALLGGLAARRFFTSTLIVPLALTVVATFVHAVVLLVLRSGQGGVPLDGVLRLIFLQALLNSILVPPLYLAAGVLERRMVHNNG